MEHRKHSSEEIDSLIDNVYWNWKYTEDESNADNEPYIDLNLRTIKVWVVITLKDGYKLGTNSECSKFYMYEVIEQCYNILKTHLMYIFDYLSYMLLRKGNSLIKTEDLDKLKVIRALYYLSKETGKNEARI